MITVTEELTRSMVFIVFATVSQVVLSAGSLVCVMSAKIMQNTL